MREYSGSKKKKKILPSAMKAPIHRITKSIKHLIRIAHRAWHKAEGDECRMMAADITFDLIFAIIPALIVLASALALLGNRPKMLVTAVALWSEFFPEQIFTTIMEYVKSVSKTRSLGGITLGLFVSVWSASSALIAIERGMNRAYGIVNTSRAALSRLYSALIVIAASAACAYGFKIYLTLHKKYRGAVSRTFFEGPLGSLFTALDLPLTLLIVFAGTTCIYYLAPRARQKLWHTLPGAVFYTACWLILLAGFTVYVRFASNFSTIHTALDTVLVLVAWLYMNALMLLVGGEINSILYADEIEERPQSKDVNAIVKRIKKIVKKRKV